MISKKATRGIITFIVSSISVVWMQLLPLGDKTPSPIDSSEGLERLEFLKLIGHIGYSGGSSSLIWLDFIQYYGDSSRLVTGYSQSPDYLEALLALEPRFQSAYFITPSAVAVQAGDPDRAIEILEAGLEVFSPELSERAYRIPLGLASLNVVYQNDVISAKGFYYLASEWYETAFPNADSPGWRELGNRLAERPGSNYLQFLVWRQLLRTTRDEETRQDILAKLDELGDVIIHTDGSYDLISPERDF